MNQEEGTSVTEDDLSILDDSESFSDVITRKMNESDTQDSVSGISGEENEISVSNLVIRLRLPEHKYFEGSRLTALDQCKFLDSCLKRRAWATRGRWKMVKKDLGCNSSPDNLKKLLDKYLQLFRKNQLHSLRGSGVEEERDLRQFLLEEIDSLIKDDKFEAKENSDSCEIESEKGEIWTANRVRENAVRTMKDKIKIDNPGSPPLTPPGTKGGKKMKLEDIATNLQHQQEENQQKFDLMQKQLALDGDRLDLERQREERQDRLVNAKIEMMQANLSILIALSQALNKK